MPLINEGAALNVNDGSGGLSGMKVRFDMVLSESGKKFRLISLLEIILNQDKKQVDRSRTCNPRIEKLPETGVSS